MTQRDLTGTTLAGYEILHKLGQGGMAIVYRAHEQSLNRIVALKVIAEHLVQEPEFVERFRREAQAAARLTHPNIVPIYRFGEDDGVFYFAMEYVDGPSLAELIEEKGALTPEAALPIFAQVADALAVAHRGGVVHRDIKPANIMIDSDGRVRVADFGVAHIESETGLTQTGHTLGTPEFMSPEQCDGLKPDARSDVYSTGVSLYRALSGRSPFAAETPVQLLFHIAQGRCIDLEELNPDVPVAVRDLIKRAMAVDPEQRFQSAEELSAAIAVVSSELAAPGDTVPYVAAVAGAAAAAATPGSGAAAATVPYAGSQPPTAAAEGSQRRVVVTAALAVVVVLGLMTLAIAAVMQEPAARGTLGSFDATPTAPATTDSPSPATPTPQPAAIAPDRPAANAATADGPASPSTVSTADDSAPPPNVSTADDSVVPAGVPATPSTNSPRPAAVPANPESAAVPTGSRAESAGVAANAVPARPAPNTVVTEVSGEYEYIDSVAAWIDSELDNRGYTLVDSLSFAGRPVVEVARVHIVVSAKLVSARELTYFGNRTTQYTVALTLRALDAAAGTSFGAPVTESIEYTALNMDENLQRGTREATRRLLRRVPFEQP